MPVDSSKSTAIEAELRTQERQLAMIFNSAREMMMLVRVEPGVLFRVVSVNREYLNKVQTVGYRFTAEDFAGKTCDEVMALFRFPAAAAASIRARYEQVIATRQVLAYDEDKNGPAGVFHGRTTITPLLDEAGACAFVLYSTQDITALKLAEQERTQSERTLRAILDHSFEFIGLLDPAGRVLRANLTSLQMAGARSEDVLGRYFWDTPWWAHAAEEQARLKDAVRRAALGEFVRFETTHAASGGKVLHVDFSLKPVKDEQGAVIFLIPEGRDITEHKLAEQAVRESEEKFAKAFRASPDAIAITDLATGRFIEANGGYERIFGVKGESLIGRSTVEMGFYQDLADRDWIVAEIQAGRAVNNLELRCYTQRREPITVLYSGEVIEMGGRKCLVSVIHDITARLRTEQARRESEEKFATAFQHSPNAMSIVALDDGRYLEINQGHQELFGYPPEEIIGRTAAEIGLLVNPSISAAALTLMRDTGRVRDLQVDVRTRSGERRTVMHCAELIRIGGRECALLTSQDITERVRAEQALHESEEKFAKAFLACPDAMSVHELESGRCVDANEGFLRLFGGRREDIIGRTPLELGFWRDPAGRKEFVEQLQREGCVRNFRTTVRRGDGRIRTCELSAEKIELGGRPHNVTVLRDITESLEAEQALRSSEDKFARAFRASPDAIAISELVSGRLVEVNEGFERLSGYARSELIGRTAAELGLWAVEGERERMTSELERTGAVRNMQVKVKNRQGRLGDFIFSAEIIQIDRQPCLIVVAHDISERLQVELALRESEEKFAKAFQVSPDIMAITDFETGRYLEVNEAHERLFGFTREESLGRSPQELGLLTDPTLRAEGVRLMERDGRVQNFRVEGRNRRGEPVVLLLSAERIRIGGRDCVLRCSHDITEQVRAEQALRESEDKFAKAFLGSPQPLIITELGTGRYIDVNLGFEEVTGYKREEVIGRTSLEINIWENLEDRKELFRRLQTETKVRGMELVFRRKDGARIITRCSFECIELAGRACMLSAIEDITQQRQTEEQLRQNQKLEALGTLAGGIAHDFNNILTAIIVNQELALMDIEQPAEVRRRLAEIGQASGRAKELVRQILTFSRQQPHERLRQHLQMIVREALGLLRASLPATIEIVQDLAPEAPPVLSDANQIHQVVMNLCTNAAHAMRDQPGRLIVRLVPRILDEQACLALPGLRPGRYAWLTVADTGHGMDAGVMARIFEPFFTTKGPGEGTGLGLPMVHGIVRDHDGAIYVQSSPGQGTTFDLYFPEAGEAVNVSAVAEAGITPGQGESVLVVDDEESICEAIGAMLTRIGYRVQTFTDPREALERFRAAPSEFNLLLTDRTMPYLSGPELIARTREWWPGLPALLMSGMTGSAPQDDAATQGGYSLVEKPVDIADLSRAVRRALNPASPPPI